MSFQTGTDGDPSKQSMNFRRQWTTRSPHPPRGVEPLIFTAEARRDRQPHERSPPTSAYNQEDGRHISVRARSCPSALRCRIVADTFIVWDQLVRDVALVLRNILLVDKPFRHFGSRSRDPLFHGLILLQLDFRGARRRRRALEPASEPCTTSR